jgi:hypothetical protein
VKSKKAANDAGLVSLKAAKTIFNEEVKKAADTFKVAKDAALAALKAAKQALMTPPVSSTTTSAQ